MRLIIDLMVEWCIRSSVEIWAYCLMPNHVHLIAVPDTEDGYSNQKNQGESLRKSENNRYGAPHTHQPNFC